MRWGCSLSELRRHVASSKDPVCPPCCCHYNLRQAAFSSSVRVSCNCACLVASAASASAQAVSFTGGPSYAFPGFVPMIAGGAGAGTFTNTTSLVATPAGFSISNGSFTYTSATADVGKSLAIDWIAFRPFNDPAGNYSNQTTLTGTVTVPVGGSAPASR